MIIYLAKLLVFVLLWASGGMALTHFFYPELWDSETTRDALPWLLAIGYFVGTVADGIANGVATVLKRE